MTPDATLKIADYIIVVLVLAVSLAIGVVFGIRDANKMTRLEYLLGGQRMSIIPVTFSLFATFQSAISVIGIPNEVYIYGTGVFYFYIGFSLSLIACYFTVIPLMFPLEVTSIYEYLQLRFRSRAVRLFSTVVASLQTILFMAIVLLAPALAIQAAVDMPLWMSILVVGIIGTVYTCIGGIKSVMWTDVFQAIIMFIGLLAMIIKGSMAVGGFSNAWSISKEDGRLLFAKYNLDPRIRLTWFGAVLGGFIAWLGTSFNQSTLQRIRSLRYLRSAKQSYLVLAFGNLCYAVLVVTAGVVTYSYFSYMRCDPFKARLVRNPNQISPYFVFHTMRDMPGMAGLYIATLVSGTLSSFSSGINALAANTVEDILERPLRNATEKTVMTVTKIAVAFYGFLTCLMAYGAQYLPGPVSQMVASVVAPIATITAAMFILGCVVPWMNKYGVLSGGIISFIVTTWLVLGAIFQGRKALPLAPAETDGCEQNSTVIIVHESTFIVNSSISACGDTISKSPMCSQSPQPDSSSSHPFSFYDISYEWYSVVAFVTCVIAGLVVSYATRNKCQKLSRTDPKLLFPICRRFVSVDAPEDLGTGEMDRLNNEEKPDA